MPGANYNVKQHKKGYKKGRRKGMTVPYLWDLRPGMETVCGGEGEFESDCCTPELI